MQIKIRIAYRMQATRNFAQKSKYVHLPENIEKQTVNLHLRYTINYVLYKYTYNRFKC